MSDPQLTRSWPDSASLVIVLEAGAIISASNASESKAPNPSGLPDVLRTRLERFDGIIDEITRARPLDLQYLQLDTAFASLYVLERVQALLVEHEVQHSKDMVTPLIGTKDMAQIRTHISLILNWGIELLFSRLLPTLPDRPARSSRVPPGAQIIDLTTAHEDYVLLFNIADRLLKIILPEGPHEPSSTTFVAMTILNRGFTDLLRVCIFLAWLPNDVRSDLPSTPNLKLYVTRLLNGSQPAQSITALGTIMRKTQKPPHVRKVCRILSTEQLLRPAGVAGLLSSVFGEDVSSTEAPLEKLQSTSNVLNTLPPNMPPEEYYPIMIPRLLHLLSPAMDKVTPPSHRRAAAFSLSRMLAAHKETETESSSTDIRQNIVQWCLLDSFKPILRPKSPFTGLTEIASSESLTLVSNEQTSKARSIAQNALVLAPSEAIPTLSTILLNTDPSPELIDILLQPIAPQLYALLEHLRTSKTADPILRETVEGLLAIWARAARKLEIVDALWNVIEGKGGEWDVEDSGELRVSVRSETLPSLTLVQLVDLQEGNFDMEENEEANPFNLHPHPLHFARFLKSIKRDDVASALYLRILDAHVKLDKEDGPLRKLLLFKLSMQISTQLGAEAAADSPLRHPDVTRTLMFIKMSLDQDDALQEPDAGERGKLSRESLRFVSEEEGDQEECDSDDEDLAPGLEGVSKREHLSVTAVNLLLALLEEHPDLSPKTVPILNEIYVQLEPLANSGSDAIRPRAREARITLTARLASSSAFPMKQSEQTDMSEESPQEKYQRALKLLQDPLLPVRAHGLLLLRELVAPAKAAPIRRKDKEKAGGHGTGLTVSTVQGTAVGQPSVDAALIPAILSIFTQSIQDEDSYIFLNAVQGLAAMVDGFGREVLKSLVDEYAKGLEGVGGSAATMTAREVDLRVRIGEALGQVIRRCGGALGKYVDIIVPRLFGVARASYLPTTLRTSAVSLLATAADTNMLALSAYAADLISAMVDLVQVESVRTTPAPKERDNAHSPAVAEVAADSPKEPDGKDETRRGDVYEGIRSQPRSKVAPMLRAEKTATPNLAEQMRAKAKAEDGPAAENTMDTRPTAANAKFPPLRRAALHFLSLLLRALIKRVYEGDQVGGGVPSENEMQRADSILGYVCITDEDGVVQVMAREAAEFLQQLRNALLGL